nr:cat eye syndrome critical region protein 5 [Hymenolepis microstoma]
MRGTKTIPAAVSASDMLYGENGKWKVPVIFLTNASNDTKVAKAAEISKVLHRTVLPSQVVTPHSALRLFSTYFDKHVVVCGYGPVKHLAQSIGFKRCSTIDEVSQVFPWLDACKPRNELYNGSVIPNDFSKIEAVVLLGEPERWEHSLQILLDILIQNGDLNKTPNEYLAQRSLPHLPLFACGSDLVWSSNAPSPRIALGSFLSCLQMLYERLTGRRLICTATLGKPSPSAYIFAMVQSNAIAAKDFGATRPLKRIYCIGCLQMLYERLTGRRLICTATLGKPSPSAYIFAMVQSNAIAAKDFVSQITRDNPEVDIYGANLFNLCLQNISEEVCNSTFQHVNSLVQDENPNLFPNSLPSFNFRANENGQIKAKEIDWCSLIHGSGSMSHIIRELVKETPKRELICSFEPILVTSGVYQESDGEPHNWRGLHCIHKKYPDLEFLYRPRLVLSNVAEAVSMILQIEKLN